MSIKEEQGTPATVASTTENSPRIRWIASDMDETFLSHFHDVSEETAQLYRKLKEHHISLVPATGRSLPALRRVLEANAPDFLPEMKLFPGVYLNGTCVFGDSIDDVIYQHAMAPEALKTFIQACYYVCSSEGLSPITLFLQHIRGSFTDWNTPFFVEHRDHWYEEVPEETGKPLIHLLQSTEYCWCQISAIGDPESITRLEAKLQKDANLMKILTDHGVQLLRPIDPMLTALPTSENKAKGILKLLGRYPEWKKEELLTIGDGNNDIEMLKLGAVSIAMGQASESVKAAAHIIAPPNASGGWHRSIQTVLFSE
eukprot:Gregarina_sp_Poly_1__6260@NODE_3320_length_1184_cov_388_660698_g2105_i0_p1_GENE_NODE_3320_length_1184_cov_388_660698_g2105_i0NODE_3320_length_1184_cov_388_660698_g2105_i0_p1_ORF_typecomplete_len314_score61_26Hydrolase_3/PF08282_12/1_9e39S6PP/PF05116_13/2_7e05HAD/PF12710_7/2e02HAD/PF12710_7/0_016HAD_2/PF13419_6/1HAD_2/PF13419_6/65_NODE_3320_length_1184_cov_388_660698_g2105_i01101051